MRELFDIHCHILPGVDDGAQNMETALKLLQMEYEDGVRNIILTPHYRKGMFETSMDKIRNTYEELVNQAKNMGMNLYLGCEFHVNMDMVEVLEAGERPAMADSKHVLCEFLENAEAAYIQERGYHLISHGFIPVFAHIERYHALMDNLDFVAELTELGCMMQVNAGTVIGQEGRHAKKFCKQLIENDLLHFIGSDAHDLKKRVPLIGACAEYLKKKAGRVYTSRILRDNPSRIISV